MEFKPVDEENWKSFFEDLTSEFKKRDVAVGAGIGEKSLDGSRGEYYSFSEFDEMVYDTADNELLIKFSEKYYSSDNVVMNLKSVAYSTDDDGWTNVLKIQKVNGDTEIHEFDILDK